MTDQERAYAYGTWAMAKTPMCATCAHYIQHYMDCGGFFKPIHAGHCTYPRLKNRLPYNLCDHYTPSAEVQEKLCYPKGYSYTCRGKKEERHGKENDSPDELLGREAGHVSDAGGSGGADRL